MKKINLLLFVAVFIMAFAFNSASAQPASFLKALPVWVSGKQTEKNVTASFRVVIQATNASQVILRLTASSNYRAWINGEFLGHGPCVAGFGYYRVDEHHISRMLKSTGDNIIAIEVTGYNIDNYYLINQPAFLQAEIIANGQVLAATASQQPVFGEKIPLFEAALLEQRVQDVPKYSIQRTHIEEYRLTASYKAWMTDPKADFKRAELERTAHKHLIERRVKYPDYTIRRYTQALDNNIYQFECNSTGFIGAKVQVRTPSKVIFTWDEILMDGDVNISRLRCNSAITYELQPGHYVLESYEPYTLQFLKVQTEGDCSVSDCYIRQYVNADVARASFACNDERLNKIYKAAVETFKQNALDIFMDCPSRERAGWLCDSYFTARVAFNLSGNTLIETNFLENFLLPENFKYIPAGMLPMCYPADQPGGNFIPNWAMWFVVELEEYLQRSGDHQMVQALQPKVMALLDYFKKYENEDGLLEKLEKWIFLEWSKANEFVQEVNYPTNMLYAKTLEVAAKLYNQPSLAAKAARIHEAVRKQSFDGTFFVDNAIRVNGQLTPQKNNRTETCQYYAFFLGTATPESHPALWKTLLKDFGPDRQAKKTFPDIFPSNAFIGNYLRLEMLSKYGHVKQLLNESIDNFLYMANLTGTLWENITTTASCNHGFASHVAHVFYRDMLGLNHIDPVNKKIDVVFHDTDIKTCRGTVPVGDQLIRMNWEKKGRVLQYTLSVPEGYTVNIKNNTGLRLNPL